MSASDFVLIKRSTGTPRVHRTTCKRAAMYAMPLSDLLNEEGAWAEGADLHALASAAIATCCKPLGAKVYIDEAVISLNVRALPNQGKIEHPVQVSGSDVPNMESDEDDGIDWARASRKATGTYTTEPLPGPTPGPWDATAVIPFPGPKHYRNALLRDGSRPLVEALGLTLVEITRSPRYALVLSGPEESLRRAEQVIPEAWATAMSGMRAWKKTSMDHAKLPARSLEAFRLEQATIVRLLADAAQSISLL